MTEVGATIRCPHCDGAGVLDAEALRDLVRSKVVLDGDCWLWVGSLDSDDYGQVAVARFNWAAHRLSYEAFNGPLSPDDAVRHTCDRKGCVNPAHLISGSLADNNRDRWERGGYRGPSGENNHFAKLTQDQVDEIRKRYAETRSVRPLAREFGISHTHLLKIVQGKFWRAS